jgi:hypothetical protein
MILLLLMVWKMSSKLNNSELDMEKTMRDLDPELDN